MVYVNIMPRAFLRYGITALVGVNSMLCEERHMRLVQRHHFGRQQEYGKIIDLAVRIKTPAKAGQCCAAGKEEQETSFHTGNG